MAISFIDTLKQVENGSKKGYKEGIGWKPHKSAEGGTRTIGYGHKLSPQEDKGNYIELPDGDIVELSNRGLTDEEVNMLLQADISKSKKIAAKQWNDSQDISFESLDPVKQNVLSEIVFNIGTLNNKSGKFGWPSLAKGIKNDDQDLIKKEMMRSYTTASGERKPLTARVNKLREYVDNPDLNAEIATPDQPSKTYPQIDPTGFLDNLTAILKQRLNAPQRASQAVSEPNTQEVSPQDALINAVAANLGKERQQDEANLARTADEAKLEATYKEVTGNKLGDQAVIDQLVKSKVLISKQYDRSSLNADVNTPVDTTGGTPNDSKDPTYGIF